MKLDGKSRSDRGKRVSIRKVIDAVIVLSAVVGVGIVVREFCLLPSGEMDVVEAPKVVRPVEAPVVIDVQEEVFVEVEEAVIEPEVIEPEAVRPAQVDEQSDTRVEAEIVAEPVYEDPKSKAIRARAALAWIGRDPEADADYIQLINDPTVSANDRHNLIEDLNEDGFADPDNPTVDDLPMIKYRIDLIDDQAPFAMDKTNADAFAEARKDLVNMENRVTR